MVLGITGGIGAGKSAVLKILEKKYGAHIISTDDIAHRLMERGTPVYENVRAHFGDRILKKDGRIDPEVLSDIVFCDPVELEFLNAAVHGAVCREVKKQISKSGALLIAIESALPNAAGFKDYADIIWYVFCPAEERIRRLMDERGYTREKCEGIMARQPSDEEFKKYAGHIIKNTGDMAELERNVDEAISQKG